MDFAITDRRLNGDTQVVAVTGEIDLFTAPEFKQRVSAPIDAGRSNVIVDLTATTFIDSSSLGVLIGAHRRLKLRGGSLVVVCDNEAIVKTFRITGLDGVFTLGQVAGRRARRRRRQRAAGEAPPRVSTGFPGSDAQSDFSRARRSRLLADIGRRLRREPDDVALMLPFEEVVEALGRTGQHDLGLQVVPLDAIVGSVDRAVDFDRGLRPTSARLRSRWERIAAAQRRGEALPPVSLYKIGDLYFVRDGHHRVSVAKSLGRTDIDAYVTEVETRIPLGEETLVSDLPLKDHERLFRERVPLPAEARERIKVSATRGTTAMLAEAVEAWGFRAMQNRGTYMDRVEVARHWFTEEYEPVVELLQGRRPDRPRARRRPTRTCASPATATACCARTSGATRCSSSCAARTAAASGAAASRRGSTAARGLATQVRPAGRAAAGPWGLRDAALRGCALRTSGCGRSSVANSLIWLVSSDSSTSPPGLALLSADRRATTCWPSPWLGRSSMPESAASSSARPSRPPAPSMSK